MLLLLLRNSDGPAPDPLELGHPVRVRGLYVSQVRPQYESQVRIQYRIRIRAL